MHNDARGKYGELKYQEGKGLRLSLMLRYESKKSIPFSLPSVSPLVPSMRYLALLAHKVDRRSFYKLLERIAGNGIYMERGPKHRTGFSCRQCFEILATLSSLETAVSALIAPKLQSTQRIAFSAFPTHTRS